MMADTTEGRLPALDSLRGVAALLVVTFHCWKLGFYTPRPGLQAHLWSWTPLNLGITGRPPVILFFVLSGFVLACSLELPARGGPASFLVRRVCRVYLPFVASVLLSVIAYDLTRPEEIGGLSPWFNHLAWTDPPSIKLLAAHLLMLGVSGSDSLNPVMWSLVYELRISMIFPLLFVLTRRRPKSALVGSLILYVAAAISIGCRSLQCTPFRGDSVPQSLLLTAYFVVFFVAGIVLAQDRAPIRTWLPTRPPGAVFALGVFGVYAMIMPNTDFAGRYIPSDLAFGVGAVALIAVVIGSRTWGRILNHPVATYLGRVSYSLYLTHNLVILVLVHALYSAISDTGLILLILGVSILTADVYCRLIENPSMRLGRRLTRSLPSARRRFALGKPWLDPAHSPRLNQEA